MKLKLRAKRVEKGYTQEEIAILEREISALDNTGIPVDKWDFIVAFEKSGVSVAGFFDGFLSGKGILQAKTVAKFFSWGYNNSTKDKERINAFITIQMQKL